MAARTGRPVSVSSHRLVPLDGGWELARALDHDGVEPRRGAWRPALVPGTVAATYRSLGEAPPRDLDGDEWWYRTTIDLPPAGVGERVVLCVDGVATGSELRVDDELVASSDSMHERYEVDLTDRAGAPVAVTIRCRRLAEISAGRRRPRARWRTRLAASELRWVRTSLIGRAPGFAAGPPPVGPWRDVRVEVRSRLDVDRVDLRPRLDGTTGRLDVRMEGRWLDGSLRRLRLGVSGPSGSCAAELTVESAGGRFVATGSLDVPDAATWWPHTHGRPHLHHVEVAADDVVIDVGLIGFRTVTAGPTDDWDVEERGLAIHVNAVPVFARGFVWSTLDAVSFADDLRELRRMLELVRDAGANVVRIPGTTVYPSEHFFDLCDELGIMVWQDLMFANFDYPFGDDEFGAAAEAEVRTELGRITGRASLVVVCGGSEITQQATMFGVERSAADVPFLRETVPSVLAELGCDAVYVPDSPWGGSLPFRNDRGIAHYFGVGGYRRPLADVRAAGVRFASECLAFANVPEEPGLVDVLPDDRPALVVTHPAWKAGVPRDVGSGWDFDDVRDHYLRELYGVDPIALRSDDHDRYLTLSRRVTGEVMQEVIGEWRRPGSSCAGAIILWWRDLVPGAGWGVVDHAGRPKAAYHLVARIMSPLAVWSTDEGLDGIRVHLANDRAEAFDGALRIAFHRDGRHPVELVERSIRLEPHETTSYDVEQLLGRFVDASGAYRFGPPGHDLVVATLLDVDHQVRCEHLRFVPGRRPHTSSPGLLGLRADATVTGRDVVVSIESDAVVVGVRARMDGYAPSDDVVDVPPGAVRRLLLSPIGCDASPTHVEITADNLRGAVTVRCDAPG